MELEILEQTAALLTAALVEPPDAARETLIAAAIDGDDSLQAWASHATGEHDAGEISRRLSTELLDQLSTAGIDSATPAHRTLILLIARLREMRELERSFADRIEAEKLAAMRELAYGASHEINNPLANIASRAQSLLSDEQDPEKRRKLAVINAQAFRAFEMIADLMLFARPPQPDKQPVELDQLVDRVLAELQEDACLQRTTLIRNAASETITIPADQTQIELAVRALVRNSMEALGSGGEVRVDIRTLPESDSTVPPMVEIVVVDTGPGIPAEVRPRIFDPYYSGREAGRGLGLGLSKCWRIAELHGGRIIVDAPPQGARFRLQLPLAGCCAAINQPPRSKRSIERY